MASGFQPEPSKSKRGQPNRQRCDCKAHTSGYGKDDQNVYCGLVPHNEVIIKYNRKYSDSTQELSDCNGHTSTEEKGESASTSYDRLVKQGEKLSLAFTRFEQEMQILYEEANRTTKLKNAVRDHETYDRGTPSIDQQDNSELLAIKDIETREYQHDHNLVAGGYSPMLSNHDRKGIKKPIKLNAARTIKDTSKKIPPPLRISKKRRKMKQKTYRRNGQEGKARTNNRRGYNRWTIFRTSIIPLRGKEKRNEKRTNKERNLKLTNSSRIRRKAVAKKISSRRTTHESQRKNQSWLKSSSRNQLVIKKRHILKRRANGRNGPRGWSRTINRRGYGQWKIFWFRDWLATMKKEERREKKRTSQFARSDSKVTHGIRIKRMRKNFEYFVNLLRLLWCDESSGPRGMNNYIIYFATKFKEKWKMWLIKNEYM